ncbi:MAG TPA: hypothetical protein VL307_07820, partial [Chitinophagaceae bacterium]|nr:hypothetical protein [Chitinophagaceae bacterium]
YFMQHRADLQAMGSAKELYNQYKASAPLWNQFAGFALKDSVNVESLTAKDKVFAQQRIIALIARQQWRNDGFYEVLNASDPTIIKGAEELSKQALVGAR